MHWTRLTALSMTAVALAATGGCGGSKSLTRAELIAKAEPICARTNQKLGAVTAATTPQQISHAASEFTAYEQQSSAELDKLTPPSSMTGDWNAILAGYHAASEAVTKLAQEVLTNQGKPSPTTVAQFANAQNDRANAAQHSGFRNCAK